MTRVEYDHRWHPLAGDWRDTQRLPEPGELIAYWNRTAWRVLEVRDVSPANWNPGTEAAWEKAGRPQWETWDVRERSLWCEPARNPQPDMKDRRGLSIFPWASHWRQPIWWRLPDPFPACVDCGLLWPCPCDDRNHAAQKAMTELDRLGSILPGCCWACGEPITGQHKSIRFDGANLLLPGGPEVAFHIALSRKPGNGRTCRGHAEDYEDRWVLDHPGRRMRLRCPGVRFRHRDFSECTERDECPGGDASHRAAVYCSTGYGLASGEAVTPPSSCGDRACRGDST